MPKHIQYDSSGSLSSQSVDCLKKGLIWVVYEIYRCCWSVSAFTLMWRKWDFKNPGCQIPNKLHVLNLEADGHVFYVTSEPIHLGVNQLDKMFSTHALSICTWTTTVVRNRNLVWQLVLIHFRPAFPGEQPDTVSVKTTAVKAFSILVYEYWTNRLRK